MACNNNYAKSTLVASVYNQNVAENGTLPFTNIRKTGTAITMNSANNAILLNKAGLYQVTLSFSANGTTDATAISGQINRNGVAMIDGLATFTPATAEGNTENASVTTIVEVDTTVNGAGSANIPLTITNTGQEATYTVAVVSVIKIA